MFQSTLLLLSAFLLLQLGACTDEYGPPFGCNGTTLHDFNRDVILTRINTFRARVALGQYEHYGLPSSSDMNKLRWDCNLESFARSAVQYCLEYAPFSGRTNPINFVYYGSDMLLNLRPNPILFSISKWQEIVNASWPATNFFNEDIALHDFTNMIIANSTAVGCYYDICEDGASAACVFSQPDAQIGTLVYTPGVPCKTGDNCISPKSGLCEFGLCVNTS